MVLSAAYIGVLAASFTLITPNRMRGQTTAIYIFCTSILGMAVGISCVAWFTDYVYMFWRCMPAFRRVAVEAKEGWTI